MDGRVGIGHVLAAFLMLAAAGWPKPALAAISAAERNTLIALYTAAGLDQFAHGLEGAVFVVYLSMLVNPRFPAPQYAFLSGLAFLLPRLVGGASGAIEARIGYDGFFLLSGGLSAAAILLVPVALRARPRPSDLAA